MRFFAALRMTEREMFVITKTFSKTKTRALASGSVLLKFNVEQVSHVVDQIV